MKNDQVVVPFDAEKLSALRQYAAKKEMSIEAELSDAIDRLYEKSVPAAVREYIENRPEPETSSRTTKAPRSRSGNGGESEE